MKIPDDLELKEDGIRLTSLVLAATIFFDASPRQRASEILTAWKAYLAWCPRESVLFYSTETMSEHKKVMNRTLGMLAAWLAPNAPERNMVSFEVKDGQLFNETPKWMFDILGIEGDEDEPSMLQIVVPYELAEEGAERLREFTIDLITSFGASHALAGYALACSPYEEEVSQTFACAKSMRHRGIDILLREADRVTVGHDGIKGVNWLTFIDTARVERLGGEVTLRMAIDPHVEMTSINGGVLMQAGRLPALGDENRRDRLPLYRNVFNALGPLTKVAFDRALDLVLEDYEEATELTLRWRRRLAE